MNDRERAASAFANNIYGVVRKYITDKDMQNNLAQQCHDELYRLAYDNNLEIANSTALGRTWRKVQVYFADLRDGFRIEMSRRGLH
jgi:hypothetical protein